MPRTLQALRGELATAGYFPDFVAAAVETALAGDTPLDHFVHLETTFDAHEVRRHVTVLVLTRRRLIVTHVDDEAAGETTQATATATCESVPLLKLDSSLLSLSASSPQTYGSGDLPTAVTLALGWGAMRRLELEPAGCADPECGADHGYVGSLASDDIMVRVSAQAEGEPAVRAALRFAASLARALAEL